MAVNGNSIEIAGTRVGPGKRAIVDLPVATLYTHSSVNMPVQVINGRRTGPTLFVSAAIHGDELNGVEVIRRLLRMKAVASLRGALIAVPIVNVHGFLDQSRYLPDRRDLNRSFPGSARGSLAARLAHIFGREIVSKADCGIDLHTGALHRSNLPQVRADLDDERTVELARAFGVPVLINANVRDGSLREYTAEKGIPMLVYEAGEALRFDEMSIRAGVRGVLSVMRVLGMLPPRRAARQVEPVIARTTSWVRAPASGIVHMRAALGDRVAGDQVLASVGDAFGEVSSNAVSPFPGIVIGRSNLPLAHEGDALFNIAAFESVKRAEDSVGAFQAGHEQAART